MKKKIWILLESSASIPRDFKNVNFLFFARRVEFDVFIQLWLERMKKLLKLCKSGNWILNESVIKLQSLNSLRADEATSIVLECFMIYMIFIDFYMWWNSGLLLFYGNYSMLKVEYVLWKKAFLNNFYIECKCNKMRTVWKWILTLLIFLIYIKEIIIQNKNCKKISLMFCSVYFFLK